MLVWFDPKNQEGPKRPDTGEVDVPEGSDCPRGKTQWATRAAAGQHRDWMRRSRLAERSLKAYRCPECGLFHIGHRGRHKEVLRNRSARRR